MKKKIEIGMTNWDALYFWALIRWVRDFVALTWNSSFREFATTDLINMHQYMHGRLLNRCKYTL